jgi:hypothetical protein
MMHRRHFLGTVTLVLAALVRSAMALAQQMQEKPQIKQSEAKLVIMRTVEKMSQAAQSRTGVGFSEEEKIELADSILSNMKDRGTYAFIDP